jgi:tRNA-dependent cyclodipeptide synthase
MLEPNRYRVRVNACPEWVGYDSCTLGISVGQPYHEGEKFAATVEWAARHFEHIRVDVSDTLQRHRLIGAGATPAEAARASLHAGDRWIAEAMPVLAESGRPFAIVRWNTWLRHPEFAVVHRTYSRLAETDAVLRLAVNRDIDDFIARQSRRGLLPPDETTTRAASRAYLIEELAAITLQGAAERSARIYPGPELASFKVLRQGLVPGAPAGLDRDYYVQVNLERRKAPQPQQTATPQLRIA